MVIVCLISRGIAPVESILEMQEYIRLYNLTFSPVLRRPLVDAKNEAVRYALLRGADLLLIEDDIIADAAIWDRMIIDDDPGKILTVEARCNGGAMNTQRNGSGEFVFTGTCFMRVPCAILGRLPQPVFEARNYHADRNGKLLLGGPNVRHAHSDVYFWYQVAQLDPRPEIGIIGEARHIRHALNMSSSHDAPHKLEFW